MKGNLYLLACALIWGTGFIFQKGVANEIDALTFNMIRFAIAALAMSMLYLLPRKLFIDTSTVDSGVYRPKFFDHQHGSFYVGVISGFTMFMGITLQQWGLAYTTAGKSGFITSLCIVIVPILGLSIGQRCGREVLVAIFMAVIGFYFIGRDGVQEEGGFSSGLNKGDWITLITIFFWALHVVILGLGVRGGNLLRIATAQFVTVSLLSALGLILMLIIGKVQWQGFDLLWKHRNAFIYLGVLSTSIAFTLQLMGQRTVPTANAVLILTLEGVFAAIAGVLVLKEPVTLNLMTGFTIIFTAVLVAQWQDLLPLFKKYYRNQHGN